MVNIEDLTYGQLKQIAAQFAPGAKPVEPVTPHPLTGKNVIVRTVTMIFTGKLVGSSATDLELRECSWIPETDRYMQFVENGSVKECEPYPDELPVYINKGALLDVCELRKQLPRSQK